MRHKGLLATIVVGLGISSVFFFQNCSSKKRFSYLDSVGGVISNQSVFGENTLLTPHTDVQNLVVGVAPTGQPLVNFNNTTINTTNPGVININGTCTNCNTINNSNPNQRINLIVNGTCTNCNLMSFVNVRVVNGNCLNCPRSTPNRAVIVNGRCVNCVNDVPVTINGVCVNCKDDGSYLPSDQVVCTGDITIKPEDCEDGTRFVAGYCVPICKPGQIYVNNTCIDRTKKCEVEGGEGTQFWASNSYGLCIVGKCYQDQGYMPDGKDCKYKCDKNTETYSEDGQCHKVVDDCNVENGHGTKRWNGHSYDQCQITCDTGFKLVNNKCINPCPDSTKQIYVNDMCTNLVDDCPITNGHGTTTWNRSTHSYDRCIVDRCDSGYVISGNVCTPVIPPVEEPPPQEADPLIVDLGNSPQGISLTSQLRGILFDILGAFSTPAHSKKLISWTTNARFQFLVLPDANGRVAGIDQLFGNNTTGPDGQGTFDGFAALTKYDGTTVDGKTRVSNADGIIDAHDPVFKKLALWTDMNRDGSAQPNEMTTLESARIKSIDLHYDGNFYEVDKYGNKTTYKSIVTFEDGRTTLIFDLWFRYFTPLSGSCYKITK